jgi:cytochrome c5
MCHASGAAGAPKFGDAAAWGPRIGKGMDTLYSNAINGFNGMPAKGLCMDCSDDEVNAAVDHMTSNSQ